MHVRAFHTAADSRLSPAPSSVRRAFGPARRGAFSLIELVVAVGIITLLAAIGIPVISLVRDSAKRATELSSLRQLTAACVTYAQENDGTLPQGRAAFATAGRDDYTWISYSACWGLLLQVSPSLNSVNSCQSVKETFDGADDFGSSGSYYTNPLDTRVGWVYWGGRDDLMHNGVVQYRSLRRLGQHLTPGSRTLWTCLCWDSAGQGGSSLCPHVGTSCIQYPNGVALKPPPDGLNVGLDDGSASFIHWADLITIQQANGYKLYYQP